MSRRTKSPAHDSRDSTNLLDRFAQLLHQGSQYSLPGPMGATSALERAGAFPAKLRSSDSSSDSTSSGSIVCGSDPTISLGGAGPCWVSDGEQYHIPASVLA